MVPRKARLQDHDPDVGGGGKEPVGHHGGESLLYFGGVEHLRVAIVGNAPCALTGAHGRDIDDHDVVIRINAGAPAPRHYEALGKRTSILAIGSIQAYNASKPYLPHSPELWWMKGRTRLGIRQLEELYKQNVYPAVWPDALERLCRAETDAPPSTGARLAWACRMHWQAKQITCYGMAFFGLLSAGESWWKKERPDGTVRHRPLENGPNEMAMLQRHGFSIGEDGIHRWKG